MDKSCLRCGKRAVSPPLCLACLLDVDASEYDRWLLINELVIAPDFVESEVIEKPELIRESLHECRMCGQERSLNLQGYCSHCAQVWHS